MRAWPLLPLGRFRSVQALRAARGAAIRWEEAARARGLAEEIAVRAAEGRRQASAAQDPAPATLAVELARGVSSRAAADRNARRTAREGMQAAERADRAKDRAEGASALARELRGRADALARGAGRWAERGRRALGARREREVEEAWSGARREALDS
jgi:hypothetical protein